MKVNAGWSPERFINMDKLRLHVSKGAGCRVYSFIWAN